jgi:hypothetical protein
MPNKEHRTLKSARLPNFEVQNSLFLVLRFNILNNECRTGNTEMETEPTNNQ